MQAGFGLTEYAILALYIAGSVALGLHFTRAQRNIEGYFLAERSAPSWAVAISLITADLTAISYIGCAGMVFTKDLQYAVGGVLCVPAALLVAHLFIPFLARLRVYTIYEYLEHRFNVAVRTFASALFMLQRGAHLAVAMYAASLAFSQVANSPVWGCLIVLGGLTTLYTVLGGMKAVLWTDVAQFFVLMGGILAMLFAVAMAFHWDLGRIWDIASHPPQTPMPWQAPGEAPMLSHTRFFDFRLDPRIEVTFWAIIIGTFIAQTGAYGSDQVLVQRYLAAGSGREMARSLVASALIVVPVNACLYAVGIGFVAYYTYFLNQPGHEWVATLSDAKRVLPHFVVHGLPGGLGAVVIAGLFAGTMSSFASGLNSLSTATFVDFHTRFHPNREESDRLAVRHAKWVTAAWGVAIVLVATFLGGTESIFEQLAKVMGLFAGPLVGMFLLGMLSRRANSRGVIVGTAVGVLAAAAVTYPDVVIGPLTGQQIRLSWLYFAPVGCAVTMGLGYLVSLALPTQQVAGVAELTIGWGAGTGTDEVGEARK